MTVKCPRCFRLLAGDLYAWACTGPCEERPDPAASANAGTQVRSKPVVKTQRPSDNRNWVPPQSLDCPTCRTAGREICPYCHYALLAGWRQSPTVAVALAGARATGKSVYLAIVVKQLEQVLGEARLPFQFADAQSRTTYEEHYEGPLYEARGIVPPTVAAQVASAHQREPMILKIGNPRGGSTMLVIRDVAGEDLENPAADLHYLSYFERADAVLFMFDPSAVGEVRELLKDYIPRQDREVGSPEKVLENLLRVMGASRVPIGMILSKFDTMQALGEVNDNQWRRIMCNPGAAFTRDPGSQGLGFDPVDGDLLHEEVRSLLTLLHAQKFVNAFAAGDRGQARPYRFFTVSALGDSVIGEKLHPRGIAPYRCLDPLRWALTMRGAA